MSTPVVKIEDSGAGMNPAIRNVTTLDGVRLACSEHGEGPPLLFVRGWISHLELMWNDPAFRRYFDALARHFRVIRFDMRGNGLSQRAIPQPIGLEAMVSDIEAMGDVVGPDPAVVYGQCFGGPAAIAYAARYPSRVASLVLDGTYADGTQITSKRRQDRIVNTLRDFPEAGLMLLSHYTQPRPTVERFGDVYLDDDKILPETAADLYRFGFEVDVREYLPRLSGPVLVMHRRDTRAVTLRLGRDLATAIPDAQFVVLDGVAHNSWDESPEVALAAVGQFLGVQLDGATLPSQPRTTRGLRTILSAGVEQHVDKPQMDPKYVRIVRDALREHRGSEAEQAGDGIMATFLSATDAVTCAIEIQRTCAARDASGAGLPVIRVGLNAGEPDEHEGELKGAAVDVASRIMSQAASGEVLASNVVRELCAGQGILFTDRGLSSLQASDEPLHLYEIKWD